MKESMYLKSNLKLLRIKKEGNIKMDIVFEQHYEGILNGEIVRIANIEYANKYLEEFQKRNKDIIMIIEGIKQHFMLKENANKFKRTMLFQADILREELNGVENALKQLDNL